MNQKQHIEVTITKQSDEARIAYRTRLDASVACIRFLLHQGLTFRGYDESEVSTNKGNFLELLEFLASRDETVRNAALKNAPENLKLTSLRTQKEIVNSAAIETTKAIIRDLGSGLFSTLVDESRDISIKEQMAIVLRYVDKRGYVIEQFLTIVHVTDTTALSLKKAIDSLFSKHGLSISSLRGQGYDETSNMRGEFNGLKSLIMKENECAFYIHCFARQLQLTLVAVAQGHSHVALLFNLVAKINNIVRGSRKRRDTLRGKEVNRVAKELGCGKLASGRGLNQETSIKRTGDTRWGSYYGALMNLIFIFSSMIDVFKIVTTDGASSEQRGDAIVLLNSVQNFEFAFLLHLMKIILGKTNELSQALQRKDQDIINAMALGRSRCRAEEVTNMHHYRIGIFNTIIDWQVNELDDRFSEANTELLLCVPCLDPSDAFVAFDKQKLIHLVKFYISDFSPIELMALGSQRDTYILDMRSSVEFSQIMGIGGLSKKFVELKKDIIYPLVYLLMKLALLLPVVIATVERTFSAMNIVKKRLRNRMGDEWMNDCLVTYIERDIFDTIDSEAIMTSFQNMRPRREIM